VLGQALVGRVRLWGEGEVGRPVGQVAAGHLQAEVADLSRGVAVTKVQTFPEQFGNPPRETAGLLFLRGVRRASDGTGAVFRCEDWPYPAFWGLRKSWAVWGS
jgi:hypothetical protein